MEGTKKDRGGGQGEPRRDKHNDRPEGVIGGIYFDVIQGIDSEKEMRKKDLLCIYYIQLHSDKV